MKRLLLCIMAVFIAACFSVSALAADKKADDKSSSKTQAAKSTDKKKDDAKKDKADAGLVDINSASKQELTAIPGIGDAYSAKIIAGRPYKNKTQLKTKAKIPDDVYEKIKDKVTAKQAK
ncbi:MAG: helix-hairpin-helix domain-containing protein [Nitrospirae bacterium]|nr:helix-hairpin-helix domain-containing protein [Nitrospirota bacterium]